MKYVAFGLILLSTHVLGEMPTLERNTVEDPTCNRGCNAVKPHGRKVIFEIGESLDALEAGLNDASDESESKNRGYRELAINLEQLAIDGKEPGDYKLGASQKSILEQLGATDKDLEEQIDPNLKSLLPYTGLTIYRDNQLNVLFVFQQESDAKGNPTLLAMIVRNPIYKVRGTGERVAARLTTVPKTKLPTDSLTKRGITLSVAVWVRDTNRPGLAFLVNPVDGRIEAIALFSPSK